MNCSTPGFPVLHCLPKFAQIHVHWISYVTISSSITPFSFCLQSFPASGSLPMSQFLTSGAQSIEASASASVLPMNIQDRFSLGLTGLISLESKGLSKVFSSNTTQKNQFFITQPSLWYNSHSNPLLLEKAQVWLYGPFLAVISLLFNVLSRFDIAFLPRK